MNVDDTLELTLYQRLFDSIEVRNVLHYRVAAIGTMEEEGLATAFNLDVLPAFLDLQDNDIKHYRQTVLNLNDDLGYADVTLIPEQGGTVAGGADSPFVAYGFRKNRATRQTKSGQLRIAGVPEGASSGGILSPLFQTEVDTLATALGSAIFDGTGGRYLPLIVSKNPDGSFRARSPISDFQFVSITSQNSRKYGRGI